MMVMAPRIVIEDDFKNISKGQYILMVQDKNGKNSTLQSPAFLNQTVTILDEKNHFYHIILLKKK
jgi:hypothetical protein